FVPANSQIRCLAHVVNLVVQKILAALGDAEDPDVTDYYLSNKDAPFHYEAEDDPDLHEMDQEVFSDKIDGPAEEDELRTITTKICSSPQRCKRFRTTSEGVFSDKLAPSGRKLASLSVVRDVRHRWNYTAAMIKRARLLQEVKLQYTLAFTYLARQAIDRWVFERPELRALSLDDDAWKLLAALGDLLEIFTQVTEQMSRSRTPTLPWVLPMYEGMLKHLRSAQYDALLPSLRSAAVEGLQKLEEYYSKACDSQLNIVATLLHPSLGIQWFRKIDSERDSEFLSASRAEVLFEHVYESYQQNSANEEPRQSEAPPQPRRAGKFSSFLQDICMSNVKDIVESEIVIENELKGFWNAFNNYRGDVNAPLTWWKV
ncbi:ribonuclease H-like domain-containing protein, partial [Mycena sanguinolenta]